ncbi:hypothetical protein ACFFQF_24155 [Haladaptatus pallidirubidus]|uniref:SWIM-type domain-containing protein n=1 Tax=Haladaptatus pallidirubidus TaxID=1008152 RepID=A0AAV3UIR4_9EURY|nr:hypothetical protein [Haladaptatus pallidirubidus]
MVEVTNESHEKPTDHQYIVSTDDVTEKLMACTCPHHVHRNAYCKHMAAVETATDDGSLEAFPLEETMPNQKTVTAMASTASTAGRTCKRDRRNCRTNHLLRTIISIRHRERRW